MCIYNSFKYIQKSTNATIHLSFYVEIEIEIKVRLGDYHPCRKLAIKTWRRLVATDAIQV